MDRWRWPVISDCLSVCAAAAANWCVMACEQRTFSIFERIVVSNVRYPFFGGAAAGLSLLLLLCRMITPPD